ncbi:hypothetical protein STEG23_021657 [Scotinomys teguina]
MCYGKAAFTSRPYVYSGPILLISLWFVRRCWPVHFWCSPICDIRRKSCWTDTGLELSDSVGLAVASKPQASSSHTFPVLRSQAMSGLLTWSLGGQNQACVIEYREL